MVFKCQQDSFLKEFTSNVVSCVKSKFDVVIDGKKTKFDGYEVILEDTILFPEGGGQPFDQGFLDDKRVYQVLRRGDKAIHYVTEPLDVGASVTQKIDWDRRFDHMQQHSGQHLITGVLENEYKIVTVSWWLGEEDCYIELDTPSLSEEQIRRTEETVNDLIRIGKPVTVRLFNENTPEEALEKFRSVKGLPEDHCGEIRVVCIQDVDSNMCCGTHVTNLSQLQCIKLLHTEKSKRKDKILLHFLIGNRVLKRLHGMINREQQLTSILNNGPAKHVELVEKLHKNSKVLNKNLQTVLKDLVVFEVDKLKNLSPQPKYYCLHRKEADPDFMNHFIREIGNANVFLFLSTGDEKKDGNIVLYGNETDVSDLGSRVGEILQGKGAGKGNKYQAKVSNMGNRQKVIQLLQEYFKNYESSHICL